jgi:hypothetical protein
MLSQCKIMMNKCNFTSTTFTFWSSFSVKGFSI